MISSVFPTGNGPLTSVPLKSIQAPKTEDGAGPSCHPTHTTANSVGPTAICGDANGIIVDVPGETRTVPAAPHGRLPLAEILCTRNA